MYGHFKKKLVVFSAFVCAFLVCFCLVFWRGCTYAGTGGGDSQRTERYEKRNGSAQETLGRIEGGLGSVEEEVRDSRREVSEGLSEVGELGKLSDRIAGRSEDVAVSAGRIEEGIQRIEQILCEAEKGGEVLADGGGCVGVCGGN